MFYINFWHASEERTSCRSRALSNKYRHLTSFFIQWESLPIPSFYVDPHAGRLERRPVQRYAEDIPLGCTLFRSVDDFRQLRPL